MEDRKLPMVTWKVHGVVGEEASGANEFLIAATTYLIRTLVS